MKKNCPIDCAQAIQLIFSYLDNDLTTQKRLQMEQHLKTCRACFSRAEFEKMLSLEVRSLNQQTAPAVLQQRIRSMINRF